MKIICDNCRTKYSIADEKVKGKVFKIRCKKCSNIIVVRGNQPPAEAAGGADYAAAAPAAGGGDDYSEAPTWHLVIDQQQVGPMTGSEVRDRYASGEIDGDSYIWREGFSDWLRITHVEDFADIGESTTVAPPAAAAVAPQDEAAGQGGEPQAWSAGAQQADQQADQPGGGQQEAWDGGQAAAPQAWSGGEPGGDTSRTDSGGLFGAAPAGDDPGRDLFGAGDAAPAAAPAEAPAEGGGLFGSPGAVAGGGAGSAEAGGDLFGGGGGGGGGGGQLFPQDEEPQPEQQMTGARNENSVLFSLSNLQALAMGGGGGGGVSVGVGVGGGVSVGGSVKPAAGPTGPSDGSGLIDIRSMAGVSPKPASAAASNDGLSDLGGFSAPIAAAPVLVAAAGDDRPSWLLPTIIGGSVVLVGAIVALVLVLVLRKPEPVPVAYNVPSSGDTKKAEQPGGAAATKTDDTSKATEAVGATDDTKKDEAKADEAKGSSTTARRRSSRRRHPRKKPGRTSRGSDPVLSAPSRPKSNRKRDALDLLIDGAVGSEKKASRPKTARRTASTAAASSNLPETLSRAQIQGGMRGIKGKVQGCYDRYKVPGMANVQVKIGRNGRVGSARVVGMFAGTPTGACTQAAARSARFPKFKGSPITITYPFILR